MLTLVALTLAAAAAQPGAPDVRGADARLNAQYRATMAEMRRRDAGYRPVRAGEPGYAEALQRAQRAWIGFRDANCLSVGYEYRGGSAERLSRATCVATMTETRTRELRAIQRGASPD